MQMENKKKLLVSALNLFSTYGYEGVGIARIVEEAGVTKPTMYHYYSSKLGLYEALLDWAFGDFISGLDTAVAHIKDTRSGVMELSGVFFDLYTDSRESMILLRGALECERSNPAGEKAAELRERILGVFDTFFHTLSPAAGLAGDYAESAKYSLLGLILSYVQLLDYGPNRPERDAWTQRLADQFLHGVIRYR